ncbi:protein tyrosine kinase, putative, partial [Bodo saltans]
RENLQHSSRMDSSVCKPLSLQQYVVAADRVTVDAIPLCAESAEDVLYPGLLTTTGKPDCAVLVKRYVGTDAAAVARNEVALLLHIAHRNVISVVGLVDVNPTESMVLLEEHDRANGGDITLLTRTAVDDLRTRLEPTAFSRQVLQWGLDVAAGLAHLHMNEMLHLNFRTSNTIVCGGTAKVNALGVAQRQSALDALQDSASSYVYGLGTFLHELLGGRLPCDGSSSSVLSHLEPKGVNTLLLQLLHVDPRRRGTFEAAKQRMQELLATLVITLESQPPPQLSAGLCPWAPGWLDTVDPQPSLLEPLLCLLRCPLPVACSDLSGQRARFDALLAWYQRTADATTTSSPQFSVGSQQWQDACAIMMYTCANDMLTERGRVARDVKCITPMAHRVISAVERLGVPYIGSACLVLHADTPLIQELYANYKDHFEVGKQVCVPQIARVTTDSDQMQSLAQSTMPVFVLRCCNMSAFDVSAYSAHIEPIVLATPHAFIVISTPFLSNSAVIVNVLLDISTSASYLSGDVHQQLAAALPLPEPSQPCPFDVLQRPSAHYRAYPRKHSRVTFASATSVIVNAVVKMSHHATTPNAVHSLSMALTHATRDADASVKAAFATAIAGAVARMSEHATTSHGLHWLFAALANVLRDADASVKAAFATTAIVDALTKITRRYENLDDTTPSVIRSLSSVISNLTEGADVSVVNALPLLFAFVRIVTRSATSSIVVCCLRAICNITSDPVLLIPSNIPDRMKHLFVGELSDSIFRLSEHVTTPHAVSWLSRAICNMTKVTLRRNLLWPKKFLAQKTTTIDGVVTKFAVARLSTYATTPDAVRWLSTALGNVLSGANTSVTATFATPAVAEAVVRMSYHATTPDAVHWLSTAISNVISGHRKSVKAVFATPAVVEAVARMSYHATTPDAVRWVSTAVRSSLAESTRRCGLCSLTTAIVDAVVRMSAYATTPDAVRWLASAVGIITDGIGASTKAMFATKAVVEAVATMARHARTPDAVHYLSASIVHITEGAN